MRAHEALYCQTRLHAGAHVVYPNSSREAHPRKLVPFGNSFAHFAPINLTTMLAETFRELHFIWSTSIDWSYLRRVRPNLVIVEVAERFMRIVADSGAIRTGFPI